MNKKLVATLLAVSMVISSSVMAFASVSSDEIKHSGVVETPTISVTFHQDNANITANPYGLTIGGKSTTLIGDTITVTNDSNMRVAVGITGKVTVSDNNSDLKIVTSKTGMGTSKKNADGTTTWTDAPTVTQYKQLYVEGLVTKDGSKKMTIYNSKTQKEDPISPLVYTTKGAAITTEPVLDANTGSGVKSIQFVIQGATSYPADKEWTSKDAFKVSTAFDIKASDKDVSTFES
jgi:hypothetical protein